MINGVTVLIINGSYVLSNIYTMFEMNYIVKAIKE